MTEPDASVRRPSDSDMERIFIRAVALASKTETRPSQPVIAMDESAIFRQTTEHRLETSLGEQKAVGVKVALQGSRVRHPSAHEVSRTMKLRV
jgi:hypothetical protein